MEADSAGLDRPFVCDYCPKKYLRKNNLEDHVLMEHPDTEQVQNMISFLHFRKSFRMELASSEIINISLPSVYHVYRR